MTISSVTYCDHDYYFELLIKRSGTPNQFLGVLLHTMAISGLSRVRTELFQLLVIPLLAHHPKQLHSQSAGHASDFRDLSWGPRRSTR